MNQWPLKVATICLNSRSLKAFELFFKSYCNGKFSFVESQKESQLCIVDFDHPNSMKQFFDFRDENNSAPVIGLSILNTDHSYENTTMLRKPIKHDDLKKLLSSFGYESLNAIKEKTPDASTAIPKNLNVENGLTELKSATEKITAFIQREDEEHFVGSSRDININKPNEVLQIMYQPDQMFLGALTAVYEISKNRGAVTKLNYLDYDVIIDPKSEKVFTAFSDSLLRPLCLMNSTDKPNFTELGDAFYDSETCDHELPNKKLHSHDTDAFIWKVALWTSRGRLPADTNLQLPVYLSEWPNFSHVEAFPHAMQITALLIKQPMTLHGIASTLGIPQRYAFAFYSATKALSIAGVTRRQADSIFKPKEILPSRYRPLLEKTVKHLLNTPLPSKKALNGN